MGISIENYLGNTLSSTANEDQLMPGDQKNASFFQLKISRRPPEGNEERSKNSSPSFHGESTHEHIEAVQTEGSSPQEMKRKRLQQNAEHEGTACQRLDMMVNSSDLGLPSKYIIPERFNAYQCKGKCNPRQPNRFVLHSLLKAFMNEKKKGSSTDDITTCCIPIKLRPMRFFYYYKGEFVVQTFNMMIVEECGCY